MWSPWLLTYLPLLSFQHVASLLWGGTKCEFVRKARIQPLYKARGEQRVKVFRKPLWTGEINGDSAHCSALALLQVPYVTMYHPGLLLFQETSVSEIGKLLCQNPVLARMLNSVSSAAKFILSRHRCLLELSCRFRLLCQTIIAHKLFDHVVLAFIFLNCITIALERPQIEHRSTVRTITCHPLFGTTSNSGYWVSLVLVWSLEELQH